jgi:hypothetical protein
MTNIGNSPALNFNFSSSVNTRQFFQTLQIPFGLVPGSFNSTFQLDPNCPFFRIFAGFAGDFSNNGYITSFQFQLAGTPCGGVTYQCWGPDDYDISPGPNPTSGLLITSFLGNDQIIIHSQYAGACSLIGGAYGDGSAGFISRWTALADQVKITTTPCAPASTVNLNSEVMHGVIQAPW